VGSAEGRMVGSAGGRRAGRRAGNTDCSKCNRRSLTMVRHRQPLGSEKQPDLGPESPKQGLLKPYRHQSPQRLSDSRRWCSFAQRRWEHRLSSDPGPLVLLPRLKPLG
jgi:hypothetical protein